MEVEDYTYVETTWGIPDLIKVALKFCRENPGYIPNGGPVHGGENHWYQMLVKYNIADLINEMKEGNNGTGTFAFHKTPQEGLHRTVL